MWDTLTEEQKYNDIEHWDVQEDSPVHKTVSKTNVRQSETMPMGNV